MTPPNQDPGPVDWFPGLRTGPRVAITVNPGEIDVLRDLFADYPYPGEARDAQHVLRDLDVRLGALRELGAEKELVPLLFPEFAVLRVAYEDCAQLPGSLGPRDPVRSLFIELDRRLGAAQARRAGSGDMTADEIPGRAGGEAYDGDERESGPAHPNLRPSSGYRGPRWRNA